MPPFKPTVDTFKNIPVGETDMDLDVKTLKMPGASIVNYDDHISKEQEPTNQGKYPVPKSREPERPVVEQPRVVEQPKKVQNIMDDDIFSSVVNVPPVVQPPQNPPQVPKQDIFDMGLGGVSFEPTPPTQPKPVNNDPFNILGLEMGGGSAPVQTPPPNNGGFGGDLLGFGLSGPSNPPPVVAQLPANNLLGGADLMGFGFAPTPSPSVTVNQGGFNFGQSNPPPQPPQPQNNNFGFNLLGGSQPAQQASQSASLSPQNTSAFQPIVNNNPNKILAYDNAHLQIWIDCIK